MKKLALILALLIIPCAAFGMEMLNDSTMDGITGQSGVSIAFDDIQVFVNIDRMAYIDCDGFNTFEGYNCSSTRGGALYIENFQLDVLNINAILNTTTTDTSALHATNQSDPGDTRTLELYSASCGDIPLFYDYTDTTAYNTCYVGSMVDSNLVISGQLKGLQNYTAINNVTGGFQAQALTIDVTDALPVLSQGWQDNYAGTSFDTFTIGGVLISLPTMEIQIGSLSFTPKYTGYINNNASTAANDVINAPHVNVTSDFGTIEIDGITFAVLSGWLEIAPH